jgi:hypothetical protein
MKSVFLLMLLSICISCSTIRPEPVNHQPLNASIENPEVPKKTLRDYPDILEFEIIGIADDNSMSIAIIAFEFVDNKVLGDKRELKFNSPMEIVLGEVIQVQGDNFVEIFVDGLTYLTAAKR